jgi:hypothetical protein
MTISILKIQQIINGIFIEKASVSSISSGLNVSDWKIRQIRRNFLQKKPLFNEKKKNHQNAS